MSVISVQEDLERGASHDIKNVRDYTRTFQVITNYPYDDAKLVGEAAGLPRLGDPYVTATGVDLGSTVRKISPRCDSQYTWTVSIEYSSEQESSENPDEDPDDPVPEEPLDRSPRYSYDFVEIEKAVTHDVDGTAIANVLGQPLDPPVSITRYLLQINIEINKPIFDESFASFMIGKCNQSVWRGYPIDSVLIKKFAGQQQKENGTTYYAVSYELIVDMDLWRPSLFLNAGYYSNELDDPEGSSTGPRHKKKPTDAYGSPSRPAHEKQPCFLGNFRH